MLFFYFFSSKEEKAWEKRNVISLGLKTATESLLRTVFGNEFQTAGAGHRIARFKLNDRASLIKIVIIIIVIDMLLTV